MTSWAAGNSVPLLLVIGIVKVELARGQVEFSEEVCNYGLTNLRRRL